MDMIWSKLQSYYPRTSRCSCFKLKPACGWSNRICASCTPTQQIAPSWRSLSVNAIQHWNFSSILSSIFVSLAWRTSNPKSWKLFEALYTFAGPTTTSSLQKLLTHLGDGTGNEVDHRLRYLDLLPRAHVLIAVRNVLHPEVQPRTTGTDSLDVAQQSADRRFNVQV